MMRARLALVLVAGLAALAPGCGGNDEPDPAAPTATPGRGESSSSDSAALRERPELVEEGTPGESVMNLWHYLKVGAVPAAVLSYDRPVREAVGLPTLTGALAEQEAELADLRAVVTGAERTPAGELVTIKAIRRTDGTVFPYSYLLQRRQGEWKVIFDTLAQFAVREYTINRVQNSIKPGAKELDPRSREAGAVAAERFRTAALSPEE